MNYGGSLSSWHYERTGTHQWHRAVNYSYINNNKSSAKQFLKNNNVTRSNNKRHSAKIIMLFHMLPTVKKIIVITVIIINYKILSGPLLNNLAASFI